MTLWKGFQKPKRLEIDTETLTSTYGKFYAQPFERGFGTTIGNALRRVLLSSIEGAAITAVKIEGVLHEFSSLPGVVEDLTDISMNLSRFPSRCTPPTKDSDSRRRSARGRSPRRPPGDSAIEILEPDAPVATLRRTAGPDGDARLTAAATSPPTRTSMTTGIGYIPIDSVHSPVRRVNYHVEAARIGQATDYDRLVLEVWTNGTISPTDAVGLAATLLRDHLTIFVNAEHETALEGAGDGELPENLAEYLNKSVDELELSVRSANCSRTPGSDDPGLVHRTEKDMPRQELRPQVLNEIKTSAPDGPVPRMEIERRSPSE